MADVPPHPVTVPVQGREDRSHPTDEGGTYVRMTLAIQGLILVGLGVFLWRRDWENVFLTVIVIGLTLVPAFVSRGSSLPLRN
jgi:hypothetical protein